MRKTVVFIAVVAAASLAAGAYGTSQGHATRGAAPAAASHQPSAAFLAQARTALIAYLRHNRGTMLSHTSGAAVNGNSLQSWNWAGYADDGAPGTFTHAAGGWTVPQVQCSAEDQIEASWVGLDGFTKTSNTVEQAGTTGWCYRGVATYYTWYEMYPSREYEVGKSVQPGDVIRTSVARSGANFTIVVTDSTRPSQGFTRKATCATTKCLGSSAEWIIERPAFNIIGVAPLANYGTWTLTAGVETAHGKAGTIGSYTGSTSPHKLTMMDATWAYVLTSVTSLTGNTTFTTTWHNSY
jgi:hypothetical protein